MKLGLLAFFATMLVAGRVDAAASVWAVDDGEKIRRDATDTPFERGVDNPVWQPGQPVRLFAMRNESVAMQVVVEAGPEPLDAVTVDLGMLDGPDHAHISDVGVPLNAVGRPIERFVEHFVNVRRASGGKTKGESLGWERGSGPAPNAWVGPVPDALIPVEHAPAWDPYPMHVEPRSNAIVWIDVNVPRDQRAGTYRGEARVQMGKVELATLPVELEVADAMLPDRTVDAMVFYDHELVAKRVFGGSNERQLWELLHAHRIAAMHDATKPEDLGLQREALDGSLYMPARGYFGPAPGLGDGVLALGAYGALGDANEAAMSTLQALADGASDMHLFGAADVFLYAADERCSSPRARAWRQMIAASPDPAVRRVRVAWTCSQDPSAQPVDVAMLAATWDPAQVKEARDQGKQVWEYNGELPRTGTFLLDADAVSPRVNGWLQAIYGIPRWFYWDAAHWNDRHDTEPVDPYEDPESLHGDDGDWVNGDGVLVYPGSQADVFPEKYGYAEVVPSIRLKNWRRGIEDAGYLQMARARDPGGAGRVARWLVPAAFGEAATGKPPSWSTHGTPYFEARRALLAIALGQAPVALGELPAPVYARQGTAEAIRTATGCTRGASEAGGAFALVLVVGAIATARLRRLRSAAPRAGAPAPRGDAAAGRT